MIRRHRCSFDPYTVFAFFDGESPYFADLQLRYVRTVMQKQGWARDRSRSHPTYTTWRRLNQSIRLPSSERFRRDARLKLWRVLNTLSWASRVSALELLRRMWRAQHGYDPDHIIYNAPVRFHSLLDLTYAGLTPPRIRYYVRNQGYQPLANVPINSPSVQLWGNARNTFVLPVPPDEYWYFNRGELANTLRGIFQAEAATRNVNSTTVLRDIITGPSSYT
jgi:hypothetical protein